MNLLIKLIIFLSCAVLASAVDCGIATPCQNSGVCNSGTCTCTTGFTGDLCEITISFDFNADTTFEENQGVFPITVTRVETNYELTLTITTSGTAVSADYSFSSLSVSLPNGVSERQVTLTIINDNIPEPDETIIVTMTHTDGTAVSRTYTIVKNDELVVHTTFLSSAKEAGASINLGGTFFSFGVNTPVIVPITVTVSSVSGAVLGTDYTVSEASQSLTFNYDQSSSAAATALLTAFTISFPDDSVAEVQKSISVDFTSTYKLGGTTSTTITIDDNDGIVISIPGISTSITEGGSFDLSATTFQYLPPGSPAVITVTAKVISGTAVLGTDFTTSPSSGELTFTYDPADASTQASLDAFTVTILDDSTVEVDKSFQVTFESAFDIIGDPTIDITITDNDAETITLQGPDSVNEDDGTATYTLTRQTTIRPVTVTYTIRASPINTALYNTNVREETADIFFAVGEASKTFTVTLEDDNEVQIAKSFTVSAEGTLVADITDKDVTIVEDDDYEVTFSGVTVNEGDPAVLTFTRDSSVNSLTVTVTTTDGTATSPSDYTAQNSVSVTFADGSLTANHNIPTTEDTTYEPQEAFTVSMSSATGLKASSTLTPVTITINDDDVEILTVADGTVNENGGTFTLTITRETTFEALTVTAETQIPSGVAHPITASDITTRTGVSINFPIGSATATFTVNIVNDGVAEADETFDVFINAPSPIVDVTATVTIVNDDDYVVTFNDPTVTEGSAAVITLTRDVTAGPLSVTVSTSDNTAVAATDYTALSAQTFNFADGSNTASATINIATTSDNLHEAQESFFFDLTSTQPLTSSRGTVTITDDDPEVLTLSGPNTVSEGDLTATIGITRTGTFEQLIVTATIVVPSAGNPITLSDLTTGVSTSVTFPVGTASVDFVVNIADDELFELDEDFQVEVSGPSITAVTKTVTITNDDEYGVTFSNAAANEGDPVTVTFTRDSSVGPLTVLASTADGTATAVSDYTALSSSPVVFADGSLSQSIDITTIDDILHEADETFTVSISTSGLKASSTGSATMTITNNDGEVLTLSGGGRVNEAVGSVVIQITRTSSFEALTVTAEIVSTSSSTSITFPIGTLSRDLRVDIDDDDLFELDEDIIIRITPPAPIAAVETTITIVNDDLYGVTFSDVTVDEGDSATVTFSRDSSVGVLVVNVATADGTAASPSDYITQSQSLTFADGASTVDLVISTVENNLFETDETFTVSLTSVVSLKASSTSTATVTITNDDSYDVAFSSATVNEGDPLRVTFTRDSSVGVLTILVTASDVTATAGSDYTAVPATPPVTFADGASSAFIDIAITEDNVYEPTETFTVSITSSSPLTAASQTPRSITITDDDVEVITLTGGGSVMENAGTVTITVSRTASFETLACSVDTELPVTGTPISPSDISMLTNFPLNFGVGTSTATITVTINNDELFELDESFVVKVDAVPNTIVDKEVTVTIQNDDLYEVTFTGSSVTEENNLDVVFTRDSSVGSLNIVLSTTDGTAAAGSDYTALSSDTVTFADGSSTVTKTVMISDDNVYEPTENFVVSMTSTETLKPSSTASASFDITDNDVEVLSITGNTNVNEEDGSVTLTINRQGDFEVLTVTASTIIPPGEPYPIIASDITLQTGVSLTFGIGTTTVEFTVIIVNDEVAEADEKFGVVVTAPAPVASVTATVTILNNDPDTVTFEPFLALYEDGQTKFVRITRTVDDKEVTVSVNSQDVTATGGVDYTILNNSPVTFPVGSLETTFPVRILNDGIDEIDERLTLVVSGPTVITTAPKVFIIVDNEGSRPFDCRRRGQNCENGADICTSDIPLCQCVGTPTREGDNCNVVIDQKNGAACTSNNVQCNNGTCVDNAGVTSCKCDPGFYGDNCQHYFLQAVCTADNMTLVANPDGNFQGKIYVEEKVDVSECTANPVPNPAQPDDNVNDNLLGWFLTVAHDSAVCDPIKPEEGAVYISYVRKVIIQYNNDTLTGVDQRVTISCRVPKDNYLVHAAVIRVDRNIPLVEESATNRFSPLELDIDMNGVLIFNYHTVAISKKLCITIRVPQAFGGLEIIDIEFNNTLPSDPKQWRVLTAGCPVGDVKAVLVDNPFYPTGNKRTIKFCFAAFKFTNSFQLTVQTSLKICLNASDCSLATCPRSRAKRQAGETQQQDVDATFNIVVPSVTQAINQNQSSEVTIVRTENECSLPMHFIPTVVCLGLLVFFLVLLCLFLTYLLSRRRRKNVEKEEPEPVATRIIPQWLVFRR